MNTRLTCLLSVWSLFRPHTKFVSLFLLIIPVVTLIACEAIKSQAGNCYVDDYKVSMIVDNQGNEYEPELMTLTYFGGFEEDVCGIHRDAVPDRLDGRYSKDPYFTVPSDGVTNTQTSLTGRTRELLDRVFIGTQSRGEFSDKLSMWPLYKSEWR